MTAWVALAIAALSLVVAIVAALYARMQGIATREQAAEARRMRELAEEERHAALTPTFTLALVPLNPGVQEHRTVVLLVTLVGPTRLGHLDEVTLTVLDDRERPVTGTGPTKEEVRAVVWGPYRFTPGVDEADRDGRTVNPLLMQRQDAGQLPVGETLLCQMDRTRSPHWYAGGQNGWERDFPTTSPVRLRISCRRDEDRWTVAEQTTFTPSRSQ